MIADAPPMAAILAGVLLFMAGAAVASCLALVAERWPRGRPVVGGRSRCDGCGAVLRAWEMVPVLGWLGLRGRCARCGARIPLRLWLAEVAGGCAALGAVAVGGSWGGALALAGFAGALIFLALVDAGHLWLPDRVTLPLILAGLAAAAVLPVPDLSARGWGAAVGWAALAGIDAVYRRVRGRSGLGGGDAKLLAAIGAWLGAAALPGVVLVAALVGLGWALGMRVAGRRVAADTPLPFGTMLAFAALVLTFGPALAG